jgi:hypothetical protein
MKHFSTLILLLCVWGSSGLLAQDAAVTSLFPPSMDCNVFASGVPLQFQYSNVGLTNLQPSITVGYQVGNGTPVTETAPGLNAGGTALYTFSTLATFPLPSTLYQVKVWTQVPGDINAANDTFFISLLSPTLANLPFVETFETFLQGAPGFLNNGWTRASSSFQNWYVSNGTVPATEPQTGPDADHTPGGSRYVFSEATGGIPGDTMVIRTPCIDLGGSVNPRLNFWYFMYGAGMGEFRVLVEDFNTGLITPIWSLSGQQQTAASDDWLEASLDLTAYAGNTVRILFVSERGINTFSDIGLDDVIIFEPLPTDAGAVAVSPTGTSCYSAAEQVDLTFVNFGSLPLNLSTDPVTVTVNITPPAGPVQTYTTTVNTGVLNVLDSLTATVTTSADFSTAGVYTYEAYTSLTGDTLGFNDTLAFITAEAIQSFGTPFFEDFETFGVGTNAGAPGTYANGWTRTFTSSNLSWFIDDGGFGTSAGTGPIEDHTPGAGINYTYFECSGGSLGDSAEIRSPCITLSGAAVALDFWYHMFGATMGTMRLYLDNKSTGQFIKLWELSGQQQTAETAPWEKVTLNLTAYLGDAVQLVWRGVRGSGFTSDMSIDDVLVYEPPPIDVAASRLIDPQASCSLGANEAVTVEIINAGSDTLTTIQAQFSVDAGPFTPLEAVSGILVPGDTITYTFAATADLSTIGNHTIDAVVNHVSPIDTVSSNDTAKLTIYNFGTSISTFPYYEDFESGPGGWEDSVIAPSVNESWAFGSPAKQTIFGAASGTNAWVTGGLGFGPYIGNEQSYVFSPCFDLSALTDPVLRLDIWYESVDNQDGAVLQYSLDGGNTWTTVGDFGDPINWYNQNTLNGQPGGGPIGWAGRTNTGTGSGGYLKAERDVPMLAGVSGVVFRIAFGANAFTNDDGFAFDNFEIFQKPPQDAAVVSVIDPESGCGLTGNSTVTIELANVGSQPFDSVDVSFLLSGVQITETLDSLLNPGDTIQYTFTAGADFSTPGLYPFTVITSLDGDTSQLNDTLVVDIQSIQTVSNYPYVEDFETGVSGWQAGGVNNSWAFGTPAKAVINGAASGDNAWITGGLVGTHPNQENSFVLGPCFDFSNLTNPTVRFHIWVEAEFSWDGAALQASTNNGATWQLVGNFGSAQGINWYNDNTILGSPGGQQQGWTGRSNTNNGTNGWVWAQHPLTGLAGQSDVLLRVVFGSDFSVTDEGFAFDDFIVFDRATVDIGTTGMRVLPSNLCLGDSANIFLDVTNYGSNVQSNFPLEVVVSGPSGTTVLNATFGPSLSPNDTTQFNFGTFSSSVTGTYELVAYGVVAGDTTYFHDSSFATLTIDSIAQDPVTTNDTLCSGGGASLQLVANSPGSDILWLDAATGGTVVGTGDTLNTPPIGSSTTFYAEATNTSSASVGLVSNSGSGSFFSLGGTGTRFDVLKTLILKTVRVYPQTAGTIVVNLTNSVGAVLRTTAVPYGGTGNDTTITLNWYIEPGLDYRLDAAGTSTGAGLFRSTSGVSYPYEEPGVISIFGNTFNQFSVYYFFYNWQIEVLDCPSNRVPAQAVLLPPISVNLGPDGAQCSGFELNATNSTATSYQWNNDPAINSPIIQADTTGVYFVEVENSVGCTDSDTVVLFIKPRPEVTVTPDLASDCDSVALAVDTVASATYFWLGPNPTGQPTNQPTFTATQSGNYYATVTLDGCVGRDTAVINILPGPTVDLGPNQQTCDTVNLDAGPGVSHLWSTGDTTQTLVVPPVAANQTISVVVTDASGCEGSDQVVINQANPPIVNLGPDQTKCGQATLNAGNPGQAFTWSTGATTQTITVAQSGAYSVSVTNQFNCTDTDTVNVDILPLPVANASFTGPVNGQTVTFLNNSSPATGLSYQWNFGDGSAIDTSAEPVHTYFVPGSFLVTLIVTNECGSDTTTLIVENIVAGLAENWFSQGLEVYPNPSHGRFFLSADHLSADHLQIEITDARGRTVLQRSLLHPGGSLEEALDLSDLAEGLYLLRVNGRERSGTQRLQVK